ncbi:MAG: class I SAM-dependent methyltransferase [Deltaproteobacteria bacterium]|nr:MAG: class I SAM-dependent methyltransferase [Deltaproteobacteria bacterium]
MHVLHFGCGWDRTGVVPVVEGAGAEIVGVEVDAAAASRYPAEVCVTDGRRLPFSDGCFDVVASEYVFEHLVDPALAFHEIARVLRPGGTLVVLTPNRWSYKSVVAALTPKWFHDFAARHLRPDARDPQDVYPTFYRANTERDLRHLGAAAGLRLVHLEYMNNGPTWFRKLPVVHGAAHTYHIALRHRSLRRLRCGLLARFVKPQHWYVDSERRPFAYRCTQCTYAPMTVESTCVRCPRCGHVFARDGRTTDTRSPRG